MPVKFDKDMLLKHRFWLLLGVTLPLIFVALFILITSVSADIEKSRKAVEEAQKKLKVSNPSGPNRVVEFEKVAGDRKTAETLVHQDAFSAETDLFTWPKSIEDRFDFQRGFFATEIKFVDTLPEEPAEGDVFHGTVKERDEDKIVVVDAKKQEATFYPTLDVKISKESKEGERGPRFTNIQEGDKLAVTYYKSKYFFDPLTDNEQREYVREGGYLSQIHPILQIVDPVDAEGNGTVQFNTWPYVRPRNADRPQPSELPPPRSKFFTFVADDWKAEDYIYEEAWLAQEDLWVQRELFRIIREANDSVGRCEFGRDDKNKPIYVNAKAADKKPARFTNPYFDLTFAWDGPSKLNVTVKNQLPRKQKLDLQFRIKFNESKNAAISTEKLLVGGEPLEPAGLKGDTLTKEITLDQGGIKRTGVFEVEQVLNWETAPVKRIDAVSVGWIGPEIALGHRDFPKGCVLFRKDEKAEAAAAAMAAPMGGGDMGPMGGGLPGGGFPGGFPGGFGGQAALVKLGINGVLKDRYLEVSDQSRRIPVGLSLIVDQDHFDRVLTAFNNSKLRFLTTQVLLNRFAGSMRPQLYGPGGVGSGAGQPGMDAPPPGILYNPMGRGEGSGGFPGAGPAGMAGGPYGAGGGMLGASDESESNVEMVIYGIVTLYERYPKRKAPDGAAPGAPAAPPAAAAGAN